MEAVIVDGGIPLQDNLGANCDAVITVAGMQTEQHAQNAEQPSRETGSRGILDVSWQQPRLTIKIIQLLGS